MGQTFFHSTATSGSMPDVLPLPANLELAQAIVRDPDGTIRFWSLGAEQLYGWSRQEAVGQISHALLGTSFPSALDDIQRSLLRDGHWVGELRHTTRDGRQIFVASHWALHRDLAGDPAFITEINIDVSERHRLEDARRRLAAIVESSTDAIIGKDLNGLVTSWNRSAETMFGYRPEEIVGRPILTLFPPDRRNEEVLIMDRILRGERVTHFETIRRHKSGQDLPVSVTISPVYGDRGEVVGASKIVRDLTEKREQDRVLRAMEADLAHAQRLNELGQLVSALVHEVTQPLTAIRNYLGAALRLLADDGGPKVRQAIQRANEQGDRAHQIIEHLRGFARKAEPQRRPEDLAATFQQALGLAMLGRPAPRPLVTVHCDPAASPVLIDRIQIEQVLFNLVRNALEAMAGSLNPTLTVTASPCGNDRTEVVVADTGPGLVPEIRERLFRPFTSSKTGGMGVGLSICRSIVQAHGGEISAEDNPGGGTLFRFTLMRDFGQT
jgi:two-component system sensor kinase FixL